LLICHGFFLIFSFKFFVFFKVWLNFGCFF